MARVLHIVQSLEAGGAERVVVEYALAHDRERYTPEICCVMAGGPLEDILRDAGVRVHILARRTRFDIGAVLRLARIIATGEFDVVHNHNFTALAIGVPAAILGGATAIVRTEHNVVAQYSPWRGFLSRLATLRENAQVGVSRAVRASHIQAGRIRPGRFVAIWNGIDDGRLTVHADDISVRTELGIPESAVLCITVGSLTPQKDHENLFAAVLEVRKTHSDVYFVVVGGGALEESLRARISELGLESHVLLLGTRLDVPRLLNAADVFVLPSAWEGLPITILEVMASGVPCIATDVGGVAEVIVNGVSGFIVPPHDPGLLAERILELAQDPELRARMAASSRSVYEGAYTSQAMTRQTEALYDMALAGRGEFAPGGRIKILYVIGQLGYGGAERQLVELAKGLSRERFKPLVCSLTDPGPLERELEEAGIGVVALRKRQGAMSGASLSLARLIRKERPAIVQSYLFPANWRSLIVGRLTRVPLIITSVRNVDVHSNPILNLLERLMAPMIDRVIANAEAVKDYVIAAHGVRSEDVRVIHNGISMERVSAGNPGSSEALNPSVPEARSGGGYADGSDVGTVAMIASLTPKKDHLTFLEAARIVEATMPGTRFIIVGGGALRKKLGRIADELGLSEALQFMGEIHEVGDLLGRVDVSVLTSLKEGCSNVVLESMGAALPVVATDVGGNRELIEDGVSGYLLDTGDAEGIAARICELLSDADLRRKMGRAGRARVLNQFALEHVIGNTVKLYESELKERVPGLVEWVTIAAQRESHHRPADLGGRERGSRDARE
jgi:glycosyltransferase involved in cell wall biosynthesis